MSGTKKLSKVTTPKIATERHAKNIDPKEFENFKGKFDVNISQSITPKKKVSKVDLSTWFTLTFILVIVSGIVTGVKNALIMLLAAIVLLGLAYALLYIEKRFGIKYFS